MLAVTAAAGDLALRTGLLTASTDPIERLVEIVLEPARPPVPPAHVVVTPRTGETETPIHHGDPEPGDGVRFDPVEDRLLQPPEDWPAPPVLLPSSETAAPPIDLDDEMQDLLRRIRLPHMREAATRLFTTAEAMGWGPAEVLRAFLREEADGRCRSSVATRRAAAHFPTGRTLDSWTPDLSSLPAPTQGELLGLEWVERRENLVLWGPPGTGKTFFAEVLGHAAVDAGHRARWLSIDELGALVRRHRRDSTVVSRLQRLLRAELVVVDGIGLLPPDRDAAEGLYRVVDASYEARSVLVTSNLDPAQLGSLVPGMGSAISDRLLHHAHVCRTSGGSLRHIRMAQ